MTEEKKKKPLTLPYLDLQRDSQEVERDILSEQIGAEDIWLSAYQEGEKSVHGKVRCRGAADGSISYECRDGVQVEKRSDEAFIVSVPSLSIKDRILRRPKRQVNTLHAQGIDTFDLSPTPSSSSTHFVSGSKNGTLKFGELSHSTGQERVLLEPKREHKSDITSARFFPSGQVVLTASLDTTLRLWSFDRGTNPQTLTGHTRAITSTAFLLPTQGREILSASLDGTVRHWNVSTSSEGGQLNSYSISGGVNSLAIDSSANLAYAAQRSSSAQPIHLIDLRAKSIQSQLSTPKPSSPQVVALSPDTTLVAAGDQQGIMSLWDSRNAAQPLIQWKRTEAAVCTIEFTSQSEMLIGGADGLPYRARVDGDTVQVIEEFGASTEEEGEKIVRMRQNDFITVCAGGRGLSVY